MNSPLLLSGANSAPALLSLRPVPDMHRVRPSDPALRVVTDFAREHPITVGEDRRIDDALDDMFRFGVRALLVVREQTGTTLTPVTGLITPYDIQGERPLRFLQGSKQGRCEDIRVSDIMTPWDEVPAISWDTLREARVEHLVEIFHSLGAAHLVVIETHGDGVTVVRGLVSRTRLERQLGDTHGRVPHAFE